MRVFLLTLLMLAAVGHARAQIPIPRPPMPSPSPGDTVTVSAFRVEPPVSPLGALWRSLLVPGWGQAILGRRVTGAAFVFWEGVTFGMTLKSVHQLNYLRRTGSANVDSKKQEIQDWAVLLGFNHLLAAAEAYVAALLWDFPAELETEVQESGAVNVGVSLRFR